MASHEFIIPDPPPYPRPKLVLGRGPTPCPIALVGEAPGATEALYGRPFIGEAGQELDRILADAGLNRASCYATNVFKIRPSATDNDVSKFFVVRTDPEADRSFPAYRGRYLRASLRPMVEGLRAELDNLEARVVVALGATALWALLGYEKITAYLGTVHRPTSTRAWTVIPTYHPSAVIRNWQFRDTVVANLKRVNPELERLGPSAGLVRSPSQSFQIKVNPTLPECQRFAARAVLAPEMAVDVETAHGQIRTISFSTFPTKAFVIPFWEPPRGSYWADTISEAAAWECVRVALSGSGRKAFHNGPYDIQYLWRVHGITTNGSIEDTMHAHHAMEPEMPKSLGFLAATYLGIPEWKTMRTKAEKDDD